MPEKDISSIFVVNLKKLLSENNMTYKDLSEKIGVKASSVSMWMTGNSLPRMGTLDKIADLFNVTVESLVTSKEIKEPTPKTPELTERDKRDIAKDLDNIMEKLSSGEAGPASFDGEPLSPEAAELFKDELEIALRRLKLMNKETYTPKKYKDNSDN